MAWVKSELDVLLRRNVFPRITSNKADIKPILHILFGSDLAEMEKLGDPETGLILGGRSLMGESERM